MSATMLVHVQVGDPVDISLCLRCCHACLCTWPLTGLADTGVVSLGTVTACAECDSPRDVVERFHRTHNQRGSTR